VATRALAYPSGTAVISYQHTDALGSPVAETDATGAVTKPNSYAPYGEAYGATSIDGTGYTGHVMDQGTGLTYMQQRYYDPQIGGFLSIDPAKVNTATAVNFGRYFYANNNPYRFNDPDGRAPNAKENPNPKLANLTVKEKEGMAYIVARNEGINTDGVTIKVASSPDSKGAQMGTDGVLILGQDAFSTRSNLASNLGHEIEVHFDQQIVPAGMKQPTSNTEAIRNEIDARKYQVENIERFGNTKEEAALYKSELKRWEDKLGKAGDKSK
jgi:RHS repeat-associated protein